MAEPSFHNIIFILAKEGTLDGATSNKFKAVDKATKSIIEEVPVLQNVDFWELQQHPADWAKQTEISEDFVRQMNACFVHYNGDVGLVLRFLGGEYTAEWRDTDAVTEAARQVVLPEDCDHIHRILTKGCPARFNWEEPPRNKEAYLRQGNCPTVAQHWPRVMKTLVKEVRNRHLMTFSAWAVRASPYCHTVP